MTCAAVPITMSYFPSFLFFALVLIFSSSKAQKSQSWLASNTFVDGPAPQGRANAQVLASIGDNIYVFGGTTNSKYLNDLSIYFPSTRRWVDLTGIVEGLPPSPRYGHAFIASCGKLLLFGGRSATGIECDKGNFCVDNSNVDAIQDFLTISLSWTPKI